MRFCAQRKYSYHLIPLAIPVRQNTSAHFSRKFCGSPVAQASACVVLICVGAEKSTQTEVRATRGALALRLNSAQRVAIPEPTPWGECVRSALGSKNRTGTLTLLLCQTPHRVRHVRCWRTDNFTHIFLVTARTKTYPVQGLSKGETSPSRWITPNKILHPTKMNVGL